MIIKDKMKIGDGEEKKENNLMEAVKKLVRNKS